MISGMYYAEEKNNTQEAIALCQAQFRGIKSSHPHMNPV